MRRIVIHEVPHVVLWRAEGGEAVLLTPETILHERDHVLAANRPGHLGGEWQLVVQIYIIECAGKRLGGFMCSCAHAHAYTYTHAQIHSHARTRLDLHTLHTLHAHRHKHTHIHTHTCTHAHMHTNERSSTSCTDLASDWTRSRHTSFSARKTRVVSTTRRKVGSTSYLST